MAPMLGQIVHYRGNQGLCAPRAAIVTATADTLDRRGVEAGQVPALTDAQHVHLWVFTPGDRGGFPEYDIPRGEPTDPERAAVHTIPPGTWCPLPKEG